jgi:type I restriction enzyme S subunit
MNSKTLGWANLKIKDVVRSIKCGISLTAIDRPAMGDEHGILTLAAISHGRFDATANKAIAVGNGSRLGPSIKADSVLFSRSNTVDLVGACVFVDHDDEYLHLPDLIWELSVDKFRFNPKWLYFALTCPSFRLQINRRVTGTSASMKKLSMTSLRSMEICAPPSL